MAIRRQKWKDKLRPAKFRGVAFYVDSSTYGSGRRGATHEFPGRDIPYREDTGRKARTYPVEGYVLGSEYRAAKEKLVSACEKEGSGELVHPYWGKVTVCVDDLSVQETAGEGGFAKFSIKFVEAGEVKFPTTLLDNPFLVSEGALALAQNAQDAFSDTLSIVGQAAAFVQSVSDKVADFADTVDTFTSSVSANAADIANLSFALRDLKANATDLLSTPSKLAAQMDNALGLLAKAVNPTDLFNSCKTLFGFGDADPAVPTNTPSRQQQSINLGALDTLVQILSIARVAVAATGMDFISTNEAINAREVITDEIDDQSLSTTNDEVFIALQKLRAEIVRAVPAPGQDLAELAEYTPTATIPALALVYDRYGSLDLESDLLSRNNIMHPGFIPGGVTLEVIDA